MTERNAAERGSRSQVQVESYPIKTSNILRRMKYYKIPGASIAVINNSAIEWAKGYGVVDVESKNPVTTENLFQAASISKVITAIGALKLVQEGRLSLDVNVNGLLKSWKIPENEFTRVEKVTLRRLLSHSAGTNVHGFPGYTIEQKLPTILQILDGKPPANTDAVRVVLVPGTKFQYSGGGTTIIQLLIEEVTQEPFSTWMEKNVLSLLGMKASTFKQPIPANYTELAAHGYLANGRKVFGNWNVYPEMAAAGLWTTPSDLARAAIAILSIYGGKTNDILTPALVKEMLTTQISISRGYSAGLGVFLIKNRGDLIFEHDGLNNGFSAYLYVHPLQGQGVAIMTNSSNGYRFMQELAQSIADSYQWSNSINRLKKRSPSIIEAQ